MTSAALLQHQAEHFFHQQALIATAHTMGFVSDVHAEKRSQPRIELLKWDCCYLMFQAHLNVYTDLFEKLNQGNDDCTRIFFICLFSKTNSVTVF
jgi:hypothetical protein